MLKPAKNGAEGGSRTHTGVTPKVFETFASAIPPLRLLDLRDTVSFAYSLRYPGQLYYRRNCFLALGAPLVIVTCLT